MQIDWWTLALQIVNFLVLVWLLERFLYRPVRAIIEERKRLAAHALAEAERAKAEADAARQRFERAEAQLAGEKRKALEDMHRELENERAQVLEEAGRKAERLIAQARQSIERERADALEALRGELGVLAADLAARILEGADARDPGDATLARIEAQLNGLPKAERGRLQRDLSGQGAKLTIVTARALPARERARWAKRLGAALALEGEPRFITDPAILGGAELRFPHAVLSFTWADQLRRAQDALKGGAKGEGRDEPQGGATPAAGPAEMEAGDDAAS